MADTAAPVFPDLAPATIFFFSYFNVYYFSAAIFGSVAPGVISRAAKGTPHRGSEGGEVALALERRHYHRPELEVLTQSSGLEVKNGLKKTDCCTL